MPQHRRQDGGGSVTDRADRRVDDRVDQLALSLVRLADDEHGQRRIEQVGALEANRLKQVAPTVFLARAGDVVERVEPDSRHHRTKCAEFGAIIKCEAAGVRGDRR
ncbi:hypothetical protein [Verrucosispora sioxanthis]|uniref:hypothetical protein n=1 Tax=Verrucosispora sioxanthis TaxID=2499994 RepID=UPI002E2AC654|nr:hypothetical protein [Verrucosispora sioxanthis]